MVLSVYQLTASEMLSYWVWKLPCAFPCLWKCWMRWPKLHSHLTSIRERIRGNVAHMQWEMGIVCFETKVLICPQSPRQCVLSRLFLLTFLSCLCLLLLPSLVSFFLFWFPERGHPISHSCEQLGLLETNWSVFIFKRSDALHQPAALPQLLPPITQALCVHTHLDRWQCSEELLQFLLFPIIHGWSAKYLKAAAAP